MHFFSNKNYLNLNFLILLVWAGYNMGAVGAFRINGTTNLTGQTLYGGHSSSVFGVIQINANQMATASTDNTITVWNINSSTLVNTYNAHTKGVTCLAVLPGGLLASGSYDSTIRVWNMQTQTVATVNVAGTVYMMMWNPIKGCLVFSMSYSIGMLNTTSMTVTSFFTGKSSYTMDIIVPSGDVILGGYSVDVFSVPSGSNLISLPLSEPSDAVRLLPDYVTVVVGTSNGTMFLMNAITGATGASVKYHGSDLNMLVVTPDLFYVISGATDALIMLWRWSTMSLFHVSTFNAADMIWAGSIVLNSYQGNYAIFFICYS
jgi:WD40 repeat protein